ncbi:MAG TPA: hypothetical protein VH170_08345 [Chthoniobacterales bacterium]|jgi:hypothetical protein|nr:hypothetical protein [Chthoniobacterales bacterium]
MSKSYFPADSTGRIAWYKNFADEFPNIGRDLDFTDAEITNAVNDAKYAVHILDTLGPDIDADPAHAANAVLSGQSSGEYVKLPADETSPTPVRPGIDTRRQARVERVKAHPRFNAEIAKRLKIDSEKVDEAKYKAELGRARQTGNFVTIPFRKAGGGVSGINLYRQGKGDKSPHKVGFYFRTPAIDTSAPRGQLTYTARAVVNGKEIGQPSDAVSVTVS